MPLKCQHVINKNKLVQKYLTSPTWKVLKKESYSCCKIMNWVKYHYTMNGFANMGTVILTAAELQLLLFIVIS
jgi:hypothetical protein